jgi:hypothetical protein
VYAWGDGATEVGAWRVETGPRPGALRAGEAFPRRGFETALAVPHGHLWGRAVALDAAGHELGRSKTIRV